MFSSTNLSPQQLSFFTAFILSLPISLGIYVFAGVWWIGVASFFIILIGSYALIHYTLQRFIYRKIKLIYKFIYQTKATQREEMYYQYILPKKSIDEVKEDVESWAEQRSAEIEKLKSNDAFRREFLQNLAHELKTPVFAIQGYVQTLIDGAVEDPETASKFLAKASKNVDRMTNLLKDLDVISKLESGEQALDKENFAMQDLIRDVFDELSLLKKEKNIDLIFKKGCESPPIIVYADKEKIRQVLMNIVTNALKYGKQDGQVIASVYKTDDTHVLIELGDDGMGIAEEHLPRIFERFYRTDTARSRKIGGSGLGLAICKHIVEAHGHSMHVRSKLDVGTTFGFSLDAKKD
jgi:two-component system, OmpR family, phosphate regulon sensor histidine kinase PhoR